jgi:hypothetical protein
VAAITAALVIGGAVVLGTVHLVLGMAADRQQMSVAGISPATMSVSAWSAGAVLAAFLLLCAALLLRTALTDRSPARLGRALLTGAAVLHAALAALAVGLVGWGAFAALIAVFVLLMLTLTLYPPGGAAPRRTPSVPASDPQVGQGDAGLREQAAQQRQ